MKLYNTPLTFVYKLNFLLIILIVSSSMTNNDRYMLEALKNDNTVAPPSQHRRLTEKRRYSEIGGIGSHI